MPNAWWGDAREYPDAAATHHRRFRAFAEGNEPATFRSERRDRTCAFVSKILARVSYRRRGGADKVASRRIPVAVTASPRQPLERLLRQGRDGGTIGDRRGGARGRPLARRRTVAHIRLLADIDTAFGQMSGLATRAVLRRQHENLDDARFVRLAAISNGHIYSLRT